MQNLIFAVYQKGEDILEFSDSFYIQVRLILNKSFVTLRKERFSKWILSLLNIFINILFFFFTFHKSSEYWYQNFRIRKSLRKIEIFSSVHHFCSYRNNQCRNGWNSFVMLFGNFGCEWILFGCWWKIYCDAVRVI